MAGPRGSGAVPLASVAVIRDELRRALGSGSRNPRGTVLLLRAAPEWRDAARLDVSVPAEVAPGGTVGVTVAACPTLLAVLAALAAPREPGSYLVVLTPLEDRDLGESVLARGIVAGVRPVRRWDLVADAFGARVIDPVLTDGADSRGVAYGDWLPEALLRAAPPGGWRRLTGAVLTRAAALNALAAARLGTVPGDSGVDTAALLEWTADPASVAGFLALPEAERDGIIEWVTRETAGRAAGVVFAMGAARIPDAVPFGLAAAALYRHEDALAARVRAEERYVAGLGAPLPGGGNRAEAMLALGDACESLIIRWDRGGRAPEAAAACERAERILLSLEGSAAAGESGVLGAGLDARLAALAAELQRALAGGRQSPAALAAAEAALDWVTAHRRGEGRQAEVGAATAAVRLARWLAADEAPPATLAAGAVSMLRSWAWADRCLLAVGQAGASRVPGLPDACRAAGDQAQVRRARLDEALDRTAAAGPQGAASSGGLLTSVSLLEAIAGPVARLRPPVIVVLDGTSAAGGIEIAEEIARGGWWAEAGRRDDGREPALVVTAPAGPGAPGQATAAGWPLEPAGFTAFWGRRESRLLRAADLAATPGEPLSGQAVTAIAEPGTVVAAVLSPAAGGAPQAVDDVAFLRAVLGEARRAGRPVILTCSPGLGEAVRHGEAPSPARAIVPVITLLPDAALLPPGWHGYDAVGHVPAWWHAAAGRFPPAAGDPGALPAPGEAGDLAAGFLPTLGARVTASARMAAQRRIVRRGPGDASIAALIDALARAGGRLTITEAAAAAGVSAVRMSGYLAQAARLLNADGYPVLSARDHGVVRGTIVSLDEQLIRQEFLAGESRRRQPAQHPGRRRQAGNGTPPRRLHRRRRGLPRRRVEPQTPCGAQPRPPQAGPLTLAGIPGPRARGQASHRVPVCQAARRRARLAHRGPGRRGRAGASGLGPVSLPG